MGTRGSREYGVNREKASLWGQDVGTVQGEGENGFESKSESRVEWDGEEDGLPTRSRMAVMTASRRWVGHFEGTGFTGSEAEEVDEEF